MFTLALFTTLSLPTGDPMALDNHDGRVDLDTLLLVLDDGTDVLAADLADDVLELGGIDLWSEHVVLEARSSDAASGLPTGKRQHTSVYVTRSDDGTSGGSSLPTEGGDLQVEDPSGGKTLDDRMEESNPKDVVCFEVLTFEVCVEV